MSRPAAFETLFGGSGPRWFSIAAHRPFLDDLAFAIDAALSPMGAEALADAVILTPTRRAARALADSFVRIGDGRAVLLPEIRALGDLDEGEPPLEPGALALDLPAAISPGRRRFELARLVAEHAPRLTGGAIDANAALALADALGRLLDALAIEEITDTEMRIERLVEGDLAGHWRRSAEFLRVATLLWPARLRELGLLDVAERRTLLLRKLAEQWRETPPLRPLVAAGSTGSAPATADLLGAVAEAPLGCVVLPGLDLELAGDAWAEVGDAHPQGAMKRLLQRAGVPREAVFPWPAPESRAGEAHGRARRRVVNEALRPAEATADWLGVISRLRGEGRDAASGAGADPIADGLDRLSLVTARGEEEAAAAAALLLRESLETPGRTAALVTPDLELARRVSARLRRWGVEADSSAGAPLSQFPMGALVALVARTAAEPIEPATLLAVLKHPRVRLGRDRGESAAARRALERRGLRGPRPRGWDGLERRLVIAREKAAAREPPSGEVAALDEAITLAAEFRGALGIAAAPFTEGQASAADAARALAEALERLAADPAGRTGSLWADADGEAAAELIAGLMEDGGALPPCTAGAFAQLVERLVADWIVRSGGATHPRIQILGAIEARLIRADRLILAGLEEGVWPRGAEIDPFLSRPMRATLGLPPPERRIGLAAHDFAQAACAPEVVLLHAERRKGQPAVMSRWLWRLETLARGADKPDTPVALPRREDVVAWARALDAPLPDPPKSLRPARRPSPRPPLEARPTELPVTGVEQWVRDPYALYAKRILGLRSLDRPDAPVDARLRGTAIHWAMERFAREHPAALPSDAAERLETAFVEALIDAGMTDEAMARERALARRLAVWSAEFERRRRVDGVRLLIEQKGVWAFEVNGAPFKLTAKADRIELRQGSADVLDFKTGAPPTAKQVKAGFSPQLTLTGAILARGGFADIGPTPSGQLLYVRLIGRRKAGEEKAACDPAESQAQAETAFAGLVRRVAAFRNPERGYTAKAAPQFLEDAGDYDHLSRQWEWHVMGGPDENEFEAAEAGE